MQRKNDPTSLISQETGLSLVEVVISIGIFAIGFLAIAGLVVGLTLMAGIHLLQKLKKTVR